MMKILENYFYENFDKFYDEIFNIFYHKIIDFLLRFFARNGWGEDVKNEQKYIEMLKTYTPP